MQPGLELGVMEAALLHSSREILQANVTQPPGCSPDVPHRSRWHASISFLPLTRRISRLALRVRPCGMWHAAVQTHRPQPIWRSQGIASVAAMTVTTAPCLLGKRRLPSTNIQLPLRRLSEDDNLDVGYNSAYVQPLHPFLRFFIYLYFPPPLGLQTGIFFVLCASNGSGENKQTKKQKTKT